MGAHGPGHLGVLRDHGAQRHARGDALAGEQDVGLDADVLDGPHLAGATHPRLDLVADQVDPVAVAEFAQPHQPPVRRDDVATLAQHGLHDDGGHLGGGDEPLHQEVLDVVERGEALGRGAGRHLHVAAVSVVRVQDAGEQRPEPGAVARLGRGERDRPIGPAVERPVERDQVLPPGGPARQLDARLHRLGPRVGEERTRGALHGRDRIEALGELGVDREEEVGRGVVDQLRRLLLDRLHHPWVAVSRGSHRDAGVHVQEPVAVDILHDAARSASRHERVCPRQRRRGGASVPLEDELRLRPRHFGDQRGRLGVRQAVQLHVLQGLVAHSEITVRDCSRMYCVT